MQTISIHDAKTNLSKYIAAAKKGDKIYIGGFGKAEVVLSRLPVHESTNNSKRSFLRAKDKIIEKPDAFSADTEQSIATLMSGD